jgi:hypothetical protein
MGSGNWCYPTTDVAARACICATGARAAEPCAPPRMHRVTRRSERTGLEGDPDVDATVLRAGSAAISRRGEKPVLAAGRCPRMIVAVLRGLVAPIAALMIVTLRRLIVTLRRLVIVPCRLVVMPRRLVVSVLGRLVAVLVLAVLRTNRQWNQSAERERRHGKNNRLPKLLTHGGIVLMSYGWSEYECPHGPYNARHQQSVVSGNLRLAPGGVLVDALKQSGCQ